MKPSSNVRGMNDEQLALAVTSTREELFKLRFQQHTGQLQNTAALRGTRRKLARIETVLKERSRGISAGPGEK